MDYKDYIEKLKQGYKIQIKFSEQQNDYVGDYWFTEIYSYDDIDKIYKIHYEEPAFCSEHDEYEIECLVKSILSDDIEYKIEIIGDNQKQQYEEAKAEVIFIVDFALNGLYKNSDGRFTCPNGEAWSYDDIMVFLKKNLK